MADPYTVLGVARDASQDDIRKAYRKLAKKSHPDLHPGDAAAEKRFKEISAANSILSDEDKRARYDRGEIDDTGSETPAAEFLPPPGRGRARLQISPPDRRRRGADDFGDIFADLFGRGGFGGGPGFAARGGDISYTLPHRISRSGERHEKSRHHARRQAAVDHHSAPASRTARRCA